MPRPRTDIQPRVLHAARHRFLADGVDGASLRSIAKEAKTSVGMVSYYFPTKDQLFMAVVEEVYARLLADIAQALDPSLSARERIENLYTVIGALDEEELEIVRLLARELLLASPRSAKIFERFATGHVPLVMQTLHDGVREGLIDGERSPVLLLMTTFAVGALPQMMLHLLGDQLLLANAPTGAALSRQLTDVLLGGIGKRPLASDERHD